MMPTLRVSLISVTDHQTALPTTILDGKTYFHATTDSSFKVQYTLEYPHNLSPKYEKIITSLKIDGEDVGYSKRNSAVKGGSSTGTFEGFYKSIDNDKYKIFPFKFSGTVLTDMRGDAAAATQLLANNNANNQDKRGTIQIELYEAYEDLNAQPTRFVPAAKGLPSGEASIDKDKKFWTQPSATVGCDETNTKIEKAGTSRPWRKISNQPFTTWCGYYHTENVIKILQVMQAKDGTLDGGEEEDNVVPQVEEAGSSSSCAKQKGKKHSLEHGIISLIDDNNDNSRLASHFPKKKANKSSVPIVIDLT